MPKVAPLCYLPNLSNLNAIIYIYYSHYQTLIISKIADFYKMTTASYKMINFAHFGCSKKLIVTLLLISLLLFIFKTREIKSIQ